MAISLAFDVGTSLSDSELVADITCAVKEIASRAVSVCVV
jgi:hypothetical protein